MTIFSSLTCNAHKASVLCGACIISFSAVLVKLSNVPPTTSAYYRVFFGFLFLLGAAAANRELYQIPPRLFVPTMLCGITFALDLYFWHTSILHIGPGLATILGNFQVFLMAACGCLFFSEKLKPRFLLAVPLAVAGLFLIIGFDWRTLPDSYRTGIIFGFLTALCYTAYLLLVRTIQANTGEGAGFSPMMLISLFCSLSLGGFLALTNGSFAIPTVSDAVSLVLLGLLSQAAGWYLIARALPQLKASHAGLILLLQPSLSFVWDVLIFARPTTPVHWLGAGLTISAIYLGVTGREPGS